MRRFPMMFVFLLSVLLASLLSAQQSSTATVPSLIRYGGTLKDAQGALISSSTLGVTFAIYKQQDGGAPIWMETQNVATDAGGSYSVLLGGTTATGLPGGLFSQQEQRWLGVQVQGQAEQPRVLMVSVPYAFKAHEAETLGGKSVSDFVLANAAGATANGSSNTSQTALASSNSSTGNRVAKGAASDGPTTFSGSTTDQIVGVAQSGMGAGVNATAGNRAVVGTATAASGYGVEGIANGSAGYGVYGVAPAANGVGVKGSSTSTTGTGVRGIEVATSGNTTGVSAYVDSSAGTAAVFNNAAGGKIVSGQNNGVEKFSVDGSGNVNSASGTYRIGNSGVVSIGASADDNLFLGVSAGTHNVAGSGAFNTFSGYAAGYSNTSGNNNTFSGYEAGYSNTGNSQGDGGGNTFSGSEAGFSNTLGYDNTFSGAAAGFNNQTGSNNAFYGTFAGVANTTGCCNAFSGYKAGYSNTIGQYNTFNGYDAGYSNTGEGNGLGWYNTFSGSQVGYSNTSGEANTFSGYQAGYSNTYGSYNTFYGTTAGYQNAGDSQGNGWYNTFSGVQAGYNNTTGSNNTFSGFQAGAFNTTGSSDIYIGNEGPGSGTESNAIRIGTQGTNPGQQSVAYIAGIYGVNVGGVNVQINSNGQLGAATSSRRFKEQVRDMGDSTNALMGLRPVTFLYKSEYSKGERTLQYGLIAEEVAPVYPELVAYDDDGQPYTVRYQYLASMLLNEVQKQYRRAEVQTKVITVQQEEIQSLQKQNQEFQQRLSRLETLVRSQAKITKAPVLSAGVPDGNR